MSLCPYIFYPLAPLTQLFPVYYGLDPLIGTVNYGQTVSGINSAERFLVCYFLGSGSLNTTKKGYLGAKVFCGTERYASKNSLDKAIVTVKFDVCPKCASFTADIFSNLDPTTRYTISILARNLQVFPALHSHHKYLIFTLLAIMGDPLNLLSVILRTRCITVAPRCRRISSRPHRHLSDSADCLL